MSEKDKGWMCFNCGIYGLQGNACVDCGYEKGYLPPQLQAYILDIIGEDDTDARYSNMSDRNRLRAEQRARLNNQSKGGKHE